MPALSPAEYEALKADIAARGVKIPVEVDEDGNILDGYHRVQICEELGIEWPKLVRTGLSEAEKRMHAWRLNVIRRHLSKAQKRAIALTLRQQGWTQDQIAELLAVSQGTISSWLSEFIRTDKLDQPDTILGKDRKRYSTRKKPRRSKPQSKRVEPDSPPPAPHPQGATPTCEATDDPENRACELMDALTARLTYLREHGALLTLPQRWSQARKQHYLCICTDLMAELDALKQRLESDETTDERSPDPAGFGSNDPAFDESEPDAGNRDGGAAALDGSQTVSKSACDEPRHGANQESAPRRNARRRKQVSSEEADSPSGVSRSADRSDGGPAPAGPACDQAESTSLPCDSWAPHQMLMPFQDATEAAKCAVDACQTEPILSEGKVIQPTGPDGVHGHSRPGPCRICGGTTWREYAIGASRYWVCTPSKGGIDACHPLPSGVHLRKSACPICGSVFYWYKDDGSQVCATCQPPEQTDHEEFG